MELSCVQIYILWSDADVRGRVPRKMDRCVDRKGEERYCVVQRWLFRGREQRRAARPQHRSMDKN